MQKTTIKNIETGVIKNCDILQKNNHKKQDPLDGETFFIIHPVLKHISILNCVS